jgi:transposase-like protein
MDGTLIKHDRRGRLRYSDSQKTELLDAYLGSGMSGPQFAMAHGVNYQTFANWLQKRRRDAAPRLLEELGSGPLALVEVEVPQAAPQRKSLEIVLPGGSCLTIRHASQVSLAARLIRELASESC